MALTSGTKFGPYEIHSPLGAGGMGEVYRARDTRLDRTVAIKILPPHLADDATLRQRFEREAKTISRLNHPHICVLYDVGVQDGTHYLVMECVEGETLAKRLEKGPLPLGQVLKYGTQIAEALDKAHRSGVMHRDLKPGNIMLTTSGAKLLDFGLAKPTPLLSSAATLTAATTQGSPVTEQGRIVGTFRYMSPEQVEGKDLDGRSDIFSLGAVLYEMLTGQHAFEGKNQLSVASAILEREPAPISATKPMTPPALDHAVKKCLAKLPDERWQSAGDLASELRWMAENTGQLGAVGPIVGAGKARENLGWFVACALLALLIAGAMWWRNSKPPEQSMHFYASVPFPAHDVALSPNGHTAAIVGYLESTRKNVIWIYELGLAGARSLTDTEGAIYPFWSADGRSLAFFADGKLKKLEISGGPAQTICDAPSGRGGTWNKDGVIVFTPDAGVRGGLYRVSAAGGTPTRLTTPDPNRGENSHRWPMFLPDGTHYLYMTANFSGTKGVNAIFIGSLDSNEKRFVVEADANAAYAAPGYLLFLRDKTLLAQRFDLKRFTVTGEPTAILTDIQYESPLRRAVFAASDNGLVLAQTGTGVALSQPRWFDRKGNEVGAVGKPDLYSNISLAPDGKLVAVDKTEVASVTVDVWTLALQADSVRRLTFVHAINVDPIWSPDVGQLIFSSNRQFLGQNLYIKNSNGAQEEKGILGDELGNLDNFPNDWSRDGKHILFTRGTDLWAATLPNLKGNLFLKAVSVLRNGQFSPDGKWVAYASNETGKWQIYVTSFPEARGKWQVSTGGGEQPRWRGDGKELFYLSSDYKVMAAPVKTGVNFDVGTPAALFQATPRQTMSLFDLFVYDVSRDGRRFLINTPVKPTETEPMSVLLNWAAKLNR